MWDWYLPISPRFIVQHDENAWFKPWDVTEVRADSAGVKHFKVLKSFMYNTDAESFCNKLNK